MPPTVFVSYSHRDEVWKDRLVKHLEVLTFDGTLDVWDDRRIAAGDNWQPEIEAAIARAAVAVLIVSPDFLASGFIRDTELEEILKRRSSAQLRVVPLIARPCAWQAVRALNGIQARPLGGHPLSGRTEHEIDEHLASLALEIRGFLPERPVSAVGTPRLPLWKDPLSRRSDAIDGPSPAASHRRLSYPPSSDRSWNPDYERVTGTPRSSQVLRLASGLCAVLALGWLFFSPTPPFQGSPTPYSPSRSAPRWRQHSTIAEDVVGSDKDKRTATYKLIILSGEYFWRLGDSTTVMNAGGQPVVLADELTQSGMVAAIEKSDDVIAVGLSSCIGNTNEETERSYQRGLMIASWLRQVPLASRVESIYMLNLGRYNEECRGDLNAEREQRVVLVVGVRDKQPGVDISESFRDALDKQRRRILQRLDITKYSNWPVASFKLIRIMG